MRFTFVLLTLGLTLSGCSCSSDSCSDGRCIADVDAAPVMDGSMLDAAPIDASRHDAGSDMGCAEAERCGGECCEAGDRCYADSCISDLGSCSDNDECVSDSYCGPEGFCVPYGVPSDVVRDEECEQAIDIEAIEPEVQCSFTEYMGTPEDLQSTPLVIDFDFDGDPSTLHPSIAFIGRGGTTRVIDGATCEWQYDVAPGFATSSSLASGVICLMSVLETWLNSSPAMKKIVSISGSSLRLARIIVNSASMSVTDRTPRRMSRASIFRTNRTARPSKVSTRT